MKARSRIIVVLCALTTVLFLGGWRGPFANGQLGPVWTLIKVFVLAFVVIWLRVSNPRLRADQLPARDQHLGEDQAARPCRHAGQGRRHNVRCGRAS